LAFAKGHDDWILVEYGFEHTRRFELGPYPLATVVGSHGSLDHLAALDFNLAGFLFSGFDGLAVVGLTHDGNPPVMA
jgi:hypothetical protein